MQFEGSSVQPRSACRISPGINGEADMAGGQQQCIGDLQYINTGTMDVDRTVRNASYHHFIFYSTGDIRSYNLQPKAYDRQANHYVRREGRGYSW